MSARIYRAFARHNGAPRARLLGRVKGRKVYRFTVDVSIYLRGRDATRTRDMRLSVIAHTATEAANATARAYRRVPQTTITAYGPQGGITERFIGWQTALEEEIAHASQQRRAQVDLVEYIAANRAADQVRCNHLAGEHA